MGVVSESCHVPQRTSVIRGAVQAVQPYIELTKPRIVAFLVFTEFCAMIVAARQLPPAGLTLAALFGLCLTAGGAAAINMWYDRDIDAKMKRTANRPLVTGSATPQAALGLGIVLSLAGTVWLWLTVNALAAGLAAAGCFYYAVVYTMWLKRGTAQNIVIGGGAGAFPPLVGWAAVTGHLAWPAWLMFAVIFFWTPSHFWGLALYRNEDYIRAGVPMLPVVRGERVTKIQMTLHTLILVVVSLLLGSSVRLGWAYESAAIALGGAFLLCHYALWREPAGQKQWAKRTFFASLAYLPALFTSLAVCAVL